MDKKQAQTMKAFGYTMEDIGKTCPKTTYYNQQGEALPNLPADPYHMERYLKRGFTLTPPGPGTPERPLYVSDKPKIRR